ncbi:tumor necrosis factor receptor superfamily member 10B [Parasteatoda tepidariorum]|uniref:tumor necrosis factor receptor superfamily member 10B n=1 Tax=Parasteatoda tepidariorum TaxID=114398 RepID=UPI001C720CA5|nr:tumor necrosis factor receptor superfamily member 10B [Parasteatoda tepidariorum]
MKTEYLEFGIFLLFAYLGWKHQFVMARHAHHRRTQSLDDCYHCPPGFGVERHCNRHHDTVCIACAPDHYSGHYSSLKACYPCSRCGPGLYVAHKCTASKDTICDSCHTYKGPHNEDFYERCVKPLLRSSEENKNDTFNRTISHSSEKAEEIRTILSTDLTQGVPTSIVIASGVAIATLAVIILITCIVVTRSRCKRTNSRYPYQAVATKEAVVML